VAVKDSRRRRSGRRSPRARSPTTCQPGTPRPEASRSGVRAPPATRTRPSSGRSPPAESELNGCARRTVAFRDDDDLLLTPTLGLERTPIGWYNEDEDPCAGFRRGALFTPFAPFADLTASRGLALTPLDRRRTRRPGSGSRRSSSRRGRGRAPAARRRHRRL